MNTPGHVSVAQANEMVSKEEAIIVDVWEFDEYQSVHIKGSLHIPLFEIQSKSHILSQQKYDKILMLCAAGRRSLMAAGIAISEEVPKEIYNIEGVIAAWQEQGLPVVESKG